MKYWIILLFILTSKLSLSQDTICFNIDRDTIKDFKHAHTYQVILRDASNPNRAKLTTYDRKGKVKEEANFSNYEKQLKSGFFFTYWENGKHKRVEKYKADTVYSGRCFDSTGKEIAYFDYFQVPEIADGHLTVNEFIEQHLKYPSWAKTNDVSGELLLEFVVRADGTMDDLKIKTSSGQTVFDQEAIRVVKSIPKFTPPLLDGEPVNARFFLPVTFKMMDESNK